MDKQHTEIFFSLHTLTKDNRSKYSIIKNQNTVLYDTAQSNCKNYRCVQYAGLISGFSVRLQLVGGKNFGAGRQGKNLRQRHNSQALKVRVSMGDPGATPLETFWYLGLLECISSILDQNLEYLKRTQTSLTFGFLFGDSTWILYLNWGIFQKRVGSEFMWNSQRISPATGS